MSFMNFFRRIHVEDLPAAEFERQRLEQEGSILLDVRTKREFDSGHIPGAKHVNVQERSFVAAMDAMDKDAHYFVYCRSGRRSEAACKMMKAKGIPNAFNLAGGVLTWPGELEMS